MLPIHVAAVGGKLGVLQTLLRASPASVTAVCKDVNPVEFAILLRDLLV